MGSRERLWATLAIWVVYLMIMVTLITANTSPASEALHEDTLLGIVLVLSLAAGSSTIGIWSRPGDTGARASGQTRKAKRRDTHMERLVDDLSEDELVELETLLLARDQDVRYR